MYQRVEVIDINMWEIFANLTAWRSVCLHLENPPPSPYINRFLQPDTLIPDLSNPQSWNRYSYVANRPVNFSDPTGHKMCDGKLAGDCKHIPSHGSYGLNLDRGFSSKQKKNITTAVEDVAYMLWVYTDYDTPWDAWKAVYGNDFFFDMVGGDDCTRKEGKAAFACTEHNKIKVARFYADDFQNIRLMVHELGHAFDLAVCRRSVNCDWFNKPGGAAYDSLSGKLKTCESTTVDGSGCLGRFSDGPWSGEDAYWGFAGGWDNWQFGMYETGETWEVFADMYVGWVYSSWQPTDRGRNRSTFMNTTMSGYLRHWTP